MWSHLFLNKWSVHVFVRKIDAPCLWKKVEPYELGKFPARSFRWTVYAWRQLWQFMLVLLFDIFLKLSYYHAAVTKIYEFIWLHLFTEHGASNICTEYISSLFLKRIKEPYELGRFANPLLQVNSICTTSAMTLHAYTTVLLTDTYEYPTAMQIYWKNPSSYGSIISSNNGASIFCSTSGRSIF